jgi:lipopolysaccharide/colanic/teichoic acid biosynthesis glycosyltransferase
LSAEEFEWWLERERCLADRGTRRFGLLVVRLQRGDRAGFEWLSQQLRHRLRSTDMLGRLSDDRLGVLLPDTEIAGARSLSDWVDRTAAPAGLDVVREIYIYPSVSGAAVPSAPVIESRPGQVTETSADLWPLLSVPVPLWKRAMDVILSALGLIALLPLFVALAIAIRLDSPGPVIFTQWRAGRGGRPFAFYKFRSMFVDAERRKANLQYLNEKVGPIFKMRKDPRITRVGRVLRHWSLDELPQLWNVLKGDFSLVGPRPPTLDEVAKYERWQLRRLHVAGGITGLWQVSGRSEVDFVDWMRMDMRYIARRGPWFDLQLLLRSVPAVLSGRGAY